MDSCIGSNGCVSYDSDRDARGGKIPIVIYASAAAVLVRFFAAVFSLQSDQNTSKMRGEWTENAPESVLEPSGDLLEVPHPASASSLSALSLLAPLV